jgi:Fur family ferric uptake transcriptional regulator
MLHQKRPRRYKPEFPATAPHATGSRMPPHAQPAAADSARELIAARGGRVTRTRVAVIEALQRSAHPLSHDEIGATLDGAGIGHDRVTLYRALEWLVEQGIAQRIAGGERAWRFEIRRDGDHRHAHFHCERCGQIVCLEDVPAAAPALPAGFAVARAELVLHGACADCGRAGVEGKKE